jgi:hypothetical protein
MDYPKPRRTLRRAWVAWVAVVMVREGTPSMSLLAAINDTR